MLGFGAAYIRDLTVCQIIVAFHTYTGCDDMITLSQKGEGKPFQPSETDHPDAFVHQSEMELLQGSVYCKLEQLTCMLYSSKETWVNDARLKALLSKIPKKDPKCRNMWRYLNQPLYHQVNLMAHIWKCAHLDITRLEPVGHRWKFVLWLTMIKGHM